MFDVIIIGGGICGCSLLYQLCARGVSAVLLERENDLALGATKANSAIIHAGFDPEPGTLMAKYNLIGSRMTEELCARLDVPYKRVGSLVAAFSDGERRGLDRLLRQGRENGVDSLRIIERGELREREPNISQAALCALYAPSAAIVSPWELALAQAESAVQSGGRVVLDAEVTRIERKDGAFRVFTPSGEFEGRFLVNCAGAHADSVSRMAGAEDFAAEYRRGEYFLLDKSQGGLVNSVIFRLPSIEGKGVLVAPTVHGNLIVGPNNERVCSPFTATTADGLEYVRAQARLMVPGIDFRQNIRNFAGVRVSAGDDFTVAQSKRVGGFFNVAGIKSPGLSAAPAIALAVVQMLEKAGLEAREPRFSPRLVERFRHMDMETRRAAIQRNPAFGAIVCRCESVTEGEIVEALRRPVPPRSVDGVKRRCGAGMGRCQGGFCGIRVRQILARAHGVDICDVPLDRAGTLDLLGRTKEGHPL